MKVTNLTGTMLARWARLVKDKQIIIIGPGSEWYEVTALEDLDSLSAEAFMYVRPKTWVTRSGKVLTADDIERLVEEAERGYPANKIPNKPSAGTRQTRSRTSAIQVPPAK